MATVRTGIAMDFESRKALPRPYRRYSYAYPRPGLSREALRSLLMCFPVTCMLWAAIIYGAVKLAQ